MRIVRKASFAVHKEMKELANLCLARFFFKCIHVHSGDKPNELNSSFIL